MFEASAEFKGQSTRDFALIKKYLSQLYFSVTSNLKTALIVSEGKLENQAEFRIPFIHPQKSKDGTAVVKGSSGTGTSKKVSWINRFREKRQAAKEKNSSKK